MKVKKLLAGFLSAAMLLGTMSLPTFAEGEAVYEASVNDTPYATLIEAVAAAQDGDTIKLLSDVTASEEKSGLIWFMGKDGNFNFDCNGYTLTGGITDGYLGTAKITITNGKSVETTYTTGSNGQMVQMAAIWSYKNDMVVEDGEFSATNAVVMQYYSNLTIKNGTYVMKKDDGPVIFSIGGNVTIQDGIFKGAEGIDACAISAVEDGLVNVYGGTFEGYLEEKDNGQINIYGGTFSVDPTEYLAEGYVAENNGNGTWSVFDENAEPVAKIGENTFRTFESAVAAAQNGDTIKLLNDVQISDTYTISNTNEITIDFNNNYIDVTGVSIDNDSIVIGKDANVTFVGDGGIKGYKNCLTNEGGTVTLNGGTYTTTVIGRGSTLFNNSGILNVNSGVKVDAYKFAVYNEVGATCNLKGGEFVSHAHSGLTPVNSSLKPWAYAVVNSGTMNIYDGVSIKGIQGGLSATGEGETNVYGGNIETSEVEEGSAGRSFYACYAANNAKLTVLGGNFIAAKRSALYVGNEDTGLDGAVVQIKGGVFRSNGGSNAAAIQADIVGDLIIYGGTFSSDVSDYVADGYFSQANENGTYTVAKSEAKIIDTAKTTGATVTLDNLTKNDAIDHEPDATYKVVVETAPAADAAKANEAIAANSEDTNTDKAIFDISVVKTDSNGVETDLGGTNPGSIQNQQVTLTLGETPQTGSKVFVYHVDEFGTATKIAEVVSDGTNKITFTAPSFSTYAVTYTATAAAPATITSKVGVVFSPVSEGSNQYYITLKALDAGKKINRFMSADLAFVNNCATVGYEIEPAANMNAAVINENGTTREYRFDMDGLGASCATGEGITIGTITFSGYGTLDFSVDSAYASGHAVNIVNTAEAANNIVDNYMVSGGTLLVNNAVTGNPQLAADEKGTITDTLSPAKKNLTVNVAFNNTIADNAKAYQDMKAVISGGDLLSDITVNFGTDETPLAGDSYTFTQALTQNVAYNVTISGAGYRTARHTVTMTTDKTLNFWNNVKDAAEEIETGKGAKKANFLAGDIVKDNNINIYDLSAVVSYFGTDNLVASHPEYAKYDLNRDGTIDSKDVAYVLVSWGN